MPAAVSRQILRRGVQQFGDRACGRAAPPPAVRPRDRPRRRALFRPDSQSLVSGGASSAYYLDSLSPKILAAAAGGEVHGLGMDRAAAARPAGILSGTLPARYPAAGWPGHAPPVSRCAADSRAISRVHEVSD